MAPRKRLPITTDPEGRPLLDGIPLRSGEVVDVRWPDGTNEVVRTFVHGGSPAAEGTHHGAFAIVPLRVPTITARRTARTIGRSRVSDDPGSTSNEDRPSQRKLRVEPLTEKGRTPHGLDFTVESDGKTVTVHGPKTVLTRFGPASSPRSHPDQESGYDLLAWLSFVVEVYRTHGIHVCESHMPTAVRRTASGTALARGVR